MQTRAVYRAVGSSTGYKEFIGAKDASLTDGKFVDKDGLEVTGIQYTPLNDFGAGDIPMYVRNGCELRCCGECVAPCLVGVVGGRRRGNSVEVDIDKYTLQRQRLLRRCQTKRQQQKDYADPTVPWCHCHFLRKWRTKPVAYHSLAHTL